MENIKLAALKAREAQQRAAMRKETIFGKKPENCAESVKMLKAKVQSLVEHFRMRPGVDYHERSPLWKRDELLDLWQEFCDHDGWNLAPAGYNLSDLLFLGYVFLHAAKDVSASQRLLRDRKALRIDLVDLSIRLRKASRTLAWWGWPIGAEGYSLEGKDAPNVKSRTEMALREIRALFDDCCSVLVWGLGTDRSKFLCDTQDLRTRKAEMKLLQPHELGREEQDARRVIAEVESRSEEKEWPTNDATPEEAAERDRATVLRQKEEEAVWKAASSILHTATRVYFHFWTIERWLRTAEVDQKAVGIEVHELRGAEEAVHKWIAGKLKADLSDAFENRFRELCYHTVHSHGAYLQQASRTHGNVIQVPPRELLTNEESIVDEDVVYVDNLLKKSLLIDIFTAQPHHPFRDCAALATLTDALSTSTNGAVNFLEHYTAWTDKTIPFTRYATGGKCTEKWPDEMPILVRLNNRYGVSPPVDYDEPREIWLHDTIEGALAAWCLFVRRGSPNRDANFLENVSSIVYLLNEILGS